MFIFSSVFLVNFNLNCEGDKVCLWSFVNILFNKLGCDMFSVDRFIVIFNCFWIVEGMLISVLYVFVNIIWVSCDINFVFLVIGMNIFGVIYLSVLFFYFVNILVLINLFDWRLIWGC